MAKYVGAQPRVSLNRLDGGTVTNFSSTGIDDSASTQENVTITDTTLGLTGVITNTASSGKHAFNTDNLTIDLDNNRIGINVASPSYTVDINGPSFNMVHQDDGALGGPVLTLERDSDSPAADDQLATFCIKGKNDADESVVYAELFGHIIDPTDGAEKGEFDFTVMAGGTLKSVMMLTPDEIIVNDGSTSLDFHVKGDTDNNLLFVNTVTSRVGIGTTTPEQKLHVVGDVKIDGTITFSDTASGSGEPTFTIQDEDNSGSDANVRLRLADSTDATLGEMRLKDGDLNLLSDDQMWFAVDSNNSYGDQKSTFIYAHKRIPESVVVNASANITITPLAQPEPLSEQVAASITSSNSGDMSGFSVGDVCKITGCSNTGNNQLTRIIAISGDTLTVRGFRTNFTSESGGTITLSKGGGPCMHIPPYVNFTYMTYPQTQDTSRVATMAYVRQAVSDLIDSSPGALDTLNELAAAINDDANFYTTITGLIDGKTNRDFDNLTASGVEVLYDYVGSFANDDTATNTFPGSGNTIKLTHNDANNRFDVTVALNDPTLGVTGTGDVNFSGTATMTDLQDTTVSFSNVTIQSGVLKVQHLFDTESGYTSGGNIVDGLVDKGGVSNNDYVMVADSQDSNNLKKVRRALFAPPALSEDLGLFAVAMS